MVNVDRPTIICHMMMTIDGKTASGSETDILSDFFDIYTKTEDMLPTHTAWMCGRVTMQMFASKTKSSLPPLTRTIDYTNFIAPHDGSMYFFGVDTKGVLRWDNNSIKLSNVEKPLYLVIIVTASTPIEYLQYLQDKHISYLVAGSDTVDFPLLFRIMKEHFGVETLLLEGGGHLNGSVMAADLVDEISVLVSPTVINRKNAPAVFEGNADESVNLRYYSLLNVAQHEKDTVLLRYRRKAQ
jgi:2,5-diamino-6-(ribosylamino)-4(3H)-pyrimidinone 5'-phosphate reductase